MRHSNGLAGRYFDCQDEVDLLAAGLECAPPCPGKKIRKVWGLPAIGFARANLADKSFDWHLGRLKQ
jgi:hypothetical protein